MQSSWFTKPVSIATGISGDIRYIMSAQEAVSALTGNWPEKRSLRYRTAWRACKTAVTGETPAEDARAAFVDAAEQARILAE